MTVRDCSNGKMIILSKPLDTRPKVLNLFYFVSFLIGAILFVLMVLQDELNETSILFLFIFGFLFIFLGFKFLEKAFQREYVIISPDILEIKQFGILVHKESTYKISKISNFRLLSKQKVSKHPLAGNSFDYFGFQTEQQVINEVHDNHCLAFDYAGKTISFGENLYSWDFEQLELVFYEVTKNDFRYDDDYEKQFFSKYLIRIFTVGQHKH